MQIVVKLGGQGGRPVGDDVFHAGGVLSGERVPMKMVPQMVGLAAEFAVASELARRNIYGLKPYSSATAWFHRPQSGGR